MSLPACPLSRRARRLALAASGGLALATLLGAASPAPAPRARAGQVVLHDAELALDGTLRSGRPAALPARVWGALGLVEAVPLRARLRVLLRARGRRGGAARRRAPATLFQGPVPPTGVAPLDVPALAPGAYLLMVTSSSSAGQHTDRARVRVAQGLAVDVRVDRGQHLPGEPLRWWGDVRWRGAACPAAGVAVRARVRAPDQRVVWKASVRSDAMGRVDGVVPTTRAPGLYTVELTAAEAVSRATTFVHEGPRAPWVPPERLPPRLTVHALWTAEEPPAIPGRSTPDPRALTVRTLDRSGRLASAHLSVTVRQADEAGAPGAPARAALSPPVVTPNPPPVDAAQVADPKPNPGVGGGFGVTQHESPGLLVLPMPAGALTYEIQARGEAGAQDEARGGEPAAGASGAARSWRRDGLALPRVVVPSGGALEVPCDPAPGVQIVSLLDGETPAAAAWCRPHAPRATLRVPPASAGCASCAACGPAAPPAGWRPPSRGLTPSGPSGRGSSPVSCAAPASSWPRPLPWPWRSPGARGRARPHR